MQILPLLQEVVRTLHGPLIYQDQLDKQVPLAILVLQALQARPVLLVHSVLNTVEQQVLDNPQQQQVVVSVDQASGAAAVVAAAVVTVLHQQH